GADPIVLADPETGCSQTFALGDASFLHRDHQVPQFVRLEIKYVSRTHSFRDDQYVARRDHLFLRQRHEDEHMFILEYLRRSRFSTLVADQLRDTILRIVLAIETGISPRRRHLARRDLGG